MVVSSRTCVGVVPVCCRCSVRVIHSNLVVCLLSLCRSNDTKTGPVYGVRPPKSLFVYDQNPPSGISREQWAQEHADAIEEWKDRNLCPHDYTPCPFDVEGCTMEDDKLALQIHRVKVRACPSWL
jgi:hypothetical protein